MIKYRRPFESLTLLGKRARIARDVLSQLAEKKITAAHEGYLNFNTYDNTTFLKAAEKSTNCKVCALGATLCGLAGAFPAAVRGLSDYVSRDNILNTLLPYFTEVEINTIEACFEGRNVARDEDSYKNTCSIATGVSYRDVYIKYGSPAARVTAIMSNIVKNRGNIKWEELV